MWYGLRLELMIDGKIMMRTAQETRKGTELIWYDGKRLLSIKAGPMDAFQITLSSIPTKGGETHELEGQSSAG